MLVYQRVIIPLKHPTVEAGDSGGLCIATKPSAHPVETEASEKHGKTMGNLGKPWENHWKTMGKPWENYRKMVPQFLSKIGSKKWLNKIGTWRFNQRVYRSKIYRTVPYICSK